MLEMIQCIEMPRTVYIAITVPTCMYIGALAFTLKRTDHQALPGLLG